MLKYILLHIQKSTVCSGLAKHQMGSLFFYRVQTAGFTDYTVLALKKNAIFNTFPTNVQYKTCIIFSSDPHNNTHAFLSLSFAHAKLTLVHSNDNDFTSDSCRKPGTFHRAWHGSIDHNSSSSLSRPLCMTIVVSPAHALPSYYPYRLCRFSCYSTL